MVYLVVLLGSKLFSVGRWWMNMNVEHWWNDNWKGKSEVLEVPFCLPQIPSGLALGLNPGLNDETLTSNVLRNSCISKFSMIRSLWKNVKSNSLLCHVCLSVCLSMWNNLTPTGQIFIKFDIWIFFEDLSRNFKFHSSLTRITGTLHDIISCSFLSGMRSVSDKSCRENQNTHFMFSNFFFENFAVYEIVCKHCSDNQATDDSMMHTHCMLDA